jgi:hypothetical protein
MNIKIFYLAITIISLIHIFEEYFTGWVDYARQYAKNLKAIEFIIVNIIFFAAVVVSTVLILEDSITIYSISIIFLIFINSLIHIIPSIVLRKYVPGLFSALFGYLPLSIYIILYHFISKEITSTGLILSFVFGLALMSLPVLYQVIFNKASIRGACIGQ